jgi:GNAT superfamily N-acetyltransferase
MPADQVRRSISIHRSHRQGSSRARHLRGGAGSEVVTVTVMEEPEITVATPAHRAAVLESLVATFAADPVLRYLFPDDVTYPRYAAAFFGHLFDQRVPLGTVWTIGGGSVAMWDAPADADAPAGPQPPLPAAELARVRAYDDAVHGALPTERFWYLGVLGTHPRHAGRRWGHALLTAGLRRAAAEGLPAVLETSNAGNVEMYRRAGFEVVGKETMPLPIWVMRRPPTAG